MGLILSFASRELQCWFSLVADCSLCFPRVAVRLHRWPLRALPHQPGAAGSCPRLPQQQHGQAGRAEEELESFPREQEHQQGGEQRCGDTQGTWLGAVGAARVWVHSSGSA